MLSSIGNSSRTRRYGALVDFGNGVHNIFVEDPNGMNIELFERAAQPAAAPKLN